MSVSPATLPCIRVVDAFADPPPLPLAPPQLDFQTPTCGFAEISLIAGNDNDDGEPTVVAVLETSVALASVTFQVVDSSGATAQLSDVMGTLASSSVQLDTASGQGRCEIDVDLGRMRVLYVN